MIMNIFNSDNSNIAYSNIANRILKFKPMIKKPIMTNHTFFAVVTFSKISSFADINSIVIQCLLISYLVS